MGVGRTKLAGLRGRILLAAGALVLTMLALSPGLARAATCDTSWVGTAGDGNWFTPGNWSGGVPDPTKNACITSASAQVTIPGQAAEAKSLTLGGSSGSQSLEIDGTWDGSTLSQGSLTLDNGGSISAHGALTLSNSCSAGCSSFPPGDSELTVSGGTLTNQGTITTAIGAHDHGLRVLNGNITNAAGGVINVDNSTDYGNGSTGGVLANRGQINLNNYSLIVDESGDSTVFNDSGGSISDGSTYAVLNVEGGNTFKQGYGGIQGPSFRNGFTYPVTVGDGANLEYTHAGSGTPLVSTVETQGQVNLSGGPAANQRLFVDCSVLTAPSGFTNAGRVVLTGDCDSGLHLTSGTLTNKGALIAALTNLNFTREITGSLTNAGLLNIQGATSFDGPGASLIQTGGTTRIAGGVTFDASASGATFQLEKGVLEGGVTSKPAVFNGSVDNTGGNVMPGSRRSAGHMTFDANYTQGPGGTLTQIVDGPASVGYGELAVAGSATVGGTLAIKTLNDPAMGDFDTSLSVTGGLSGRFSKITGQFPPEDGFPPGWTFGYRVAYESDYEGVRVVPATGLRITKAGAGAGTVTSSPAGVSCGTTCSAPFFKGQQVTLTEHPHAGSNFAGWSGGCSGKATTCRLTMSKARAVTAAFARTKAKS